MGHKHMTGGEAVVATLQAHGIDVIFGIPGGHSLAVYDALARQNSIRHILGRHEQGLGFMADGFSRASGRIGVVTTTSGPAVANIGCAMGGATTDNSPVLVIASTVKSELVGKNRGGLHDCGEAIEIMRPVCRYVHRCNTVAEIPAAIATLINKLRYDRPGGAFCEIPHDILSAEAEVDIPAPALYNRKKPNPAEVVAAVKLLNNAKRSVLWVGTGATISGAGPEIELLAKKLGAIVAPTTLGRGILPADHPNAITPDGARRTEVSEVIAEADVVLAIGTMFKQENTINWSAKFGNKLIHIDIDPAEIGRSYVPEIGIVADAKEALTAILQQLSPQGLADPAWITRGKKAQAAYWHKRHEQSPTEMRALDILRAAVPRDGILVCDRCNLGYWASLCFPVYTPRAFQYPMGYGGLGGSLPQAFGAKIACPEKAVVCVIGDGGFQFTATELAVAVQENIPVTIVLCNNSAYGAIRANQDRNFGGRRFGCMLKNPDFKKLVAAYGIPHAAANNLETFEQVLASGIQSGKLNLIELTVELQDP